MAKIRPSVYNRYQWGDGRRISHDFRNGGGFIFLARKWVYASTRIPLALIGGMLAWLCLDQGADLHKWPSWCRCHSLSLPPVNPDWFYLPGFAFLVPDAGSSRYSQTKSLRTVKRLCVCVCVRACVRACVRVSAIVHKWHNNQITQQNYLQNIRSLLTVLRDAVKIFGESFSENSH